MWAGKRQVPMLVVVRVQLVCEAKWLPPCERSAQVKEEIKALDGSQRELIWESVILCLAASEGRAEILRQPLPSLEGQGGVP
jgi:hypothetical protein